MYQIRKAQRKDSEELFDLRIQAIKAKCINHYSTEQIEHWTSGSVNEQFQSDVEAKFYITEFEGEMVGSGMLDEKSGMVDAIFIAPKFMGKGAAAIMIQFLESKAREKGLKQLKLQSTLNAAKFYRSQGFIGEDISIYRSPKGLELACVPMEKSL
ncbi:GNAT family N-acetyltransferase [Vibrio sp. S4M6]|uniref:GNAT family N-acetyltransferase n=1 Tax=Vibrio sinus TaxID=2946865 RepID=UPI002029D189|nr:GNAT family N-acetyltransferase [Vibrio sinus]MCL9783709.1 GNAT family N-acetyltransferase [Vibrio sinus]